MSDLKAVILVFIASFIFCLTAKVWATVEPATILEIAKIYNKPVKKVTDLANWLDLQGVKDVEKFIQTDPKILNLSIQDNLEPKVRWLENQGVADIGKLLQKFPSIFHYSIL